MSRLTGALLASFVLLGSAHAQSVQQTKGDFEDKFRQLDEILPTPNVYRNASGAPGHQYWQQEADYDIDVTLDEEARRLTGVETVTYTNNSPDPLRYLWLQLDQNVFRSDSIANVAQDFGGAGRRGPAVSAGDLETPTRLSLGELRR